MSEKFVDYYEVHGLSTSKSREVNYKELTKMHLQASKKRGRAGQLEELQLSEAMKVFKDEDSYQAFRTEWEQRRRAKPQPQSRGQSESRRTEVTEPATVPSEVAGLCWGGLFLNFFWCIGNRVWLGALLMLVPLLNIFVALTLLFKGNEWAWRGKQWDSVGQFKRVQRSWAFSGVALYGVGLWFLFGQESGEAFRQDVAQFVQENAPAFGEPAPADSATAAAPSDTIEETREVTTATSIAPTPALPLVRVSNDGNNANIRSGPGLDYPPITFAEDGTELSVIATDQTRSWYNVRLENGRLGWIGDSVVEPMNSLADVPIAATIPALEGSP